MFVDIFFHVHPVGVGADLSCPYPRTPPKWRCIFPPLILQYIIPHPRNSTKWRCIFALLALQFISFRHIKTIWFGFKNGRDESAPTPYGMFATIYLRYPFRYFYLLYPTFRHVHPVGVGADLSCPYPRTPPKWHCNTPYRTHEHPQNGIAIHHTVST